MPSFKGYSPTAGALVRAGAWNKLMLLQLHMRAALREDNATSAAPGGADQGGGLRATTSKWLLWMDWDVVVTDLGFELPLEEYEERGVRLVVGGDPSVLEEPDYLKLNTGVMLLRVHPWSLRLLSAMLYLGRPALRRENALQAQSVVRAGSLSRCPRHCCRHCCRQVGRGRAGRGGAGEGWSRRRRQVGRGIQLHGLWGHH